MTDIAIRVSNLSKCYHIYDKPNDRLKQFIIPKLCRVFPLLNRFFTTSHSPPPTYHREFWALKDISFEIKKGETVGIIGRNGSGKSTLLQTICGTLTPTGGSIQTNGRIAALLELGSGFNPEFTGRENVYMNAAVLGLSNEEIDARFDEIASFADIGDFIEQPVKTYSSGMQVRLAFAVSIMSMPDIMIVDEALSVGDMVFQAKCMTALNRIQERGTTILFVSHDVGSVKSLCTRGIYLEHGIVKSIGKASEVAELYVRTMREEMNIQHGALTSTELTLRTEQDEKISDATKSEFKQSDEFDKRVAIFRYGSGGARIVFAELLDMEDQQIVSAEFNQQAKVRIYFNVDIESSIAPAYYILDDKRNLIVGSGPRQAGHTLLNCFPGQRFIATYETTLPLQEGNYSIQIQLNKPIIQDQTAEFLDIIDDAIVFNVMRRTEGRVWAKVLLPNTFEAIEV